MKLKQLLIACALVVPFTAGAEDLSYSYLQAGVTRIDVDEGGSENGYSFAGSGALNENWHIAGEYTSYDVDFGLLSDSVDAWNVGLGYNMGIADSTDFVARLSYEKLESSVFDANGYGIEVGVRHAFNENFEGGASLKHVDIEDEGDTGVELYGQYKFGTWGIVGSLGFNNDGNEVFIGPRLSF